jgi:hypothetical protein
MRKRFSRPSVSIHIPLSNKSAVLLIPVSLFFIGIAIFFIYVAINLILYGRIGQPPAPVAYERIDAEVVKREEITTTPPRGNLATPPARPNTTYYLTFEYLHKNEPTRSRVRVSEANYKKYEEGMTIPVNYVATTGKATLAITAATTNPDAAARSSSRDTFPRVIGVFFLGIALFLSINFIRGFLLPNFRRRSKPNQAHGANPLARPAPRTPQEQAADLEDRFGPIGRD